jgi:hypothetical protein
MAQWLRARAALPEDPCRGLQPPGTPALGNLMPFSGWWAPLTPGVHSCRHILQIKKKKSPKQQHKLKRENFNESNLIIICLLKLNILIFEDMVLLCSPGCPHT